METYTLSNETIDLLSDKISEMYKAAGCDKKETFRAKLLLEETLIKYQNHFDENVELTFRSYKLFGQYRFVVRLRTPSFDPFSLEENPMAFMIKSIMSSFENGMPTWKFRNLENEIVFSVRKKATVSSLTKISIAVLVSLVLGILARLVFPAETLQTVISNYLDPLSNAFSGLFCVMAVLLIFCGIALAIIHMGDIASVGALGGKIMWRFSFLTLIIAIAFTLPLLPFFDLGGNNTFNVAAKSIYDILISFIPVNLVSPFFNFNSVQIIAIAAMFGFSLLIMGQKGSNLVEIFDEVNLVAIYTNNFLNKFIAFYVAFNIFSLVTTSDLSTFSDAGIMIAVVLGAEIILLIVFTIWAKIKSGFTFSKIIKIVMPPFLVSLSSANPGAAFNCMFDAANDCEISMNTVSIWLNLGNIFFKPATTVMFVISSLFMASAYNVEMSVVWVIIAVLLSIVLAGTMPAIPGASVSVLTILYAQLGLPGDALALMITVNALLQFPSYGVDVWCLVSNMYCVGKEYEEQ